MWIAKYLKDMNETRAAQAAGYSHPAVTAAKLLNPNLYPHVAAAVEEGLAKKREECRIEARRVVMALLPIAEFDPLDLVNEDDSPKDLRDVPEHVRRAVKDVVVEEQRDAGAG